MKRPGVALVEVIVAGLILAAGLGSIFSLTGASMGTQTEGANRIVAAWLADGLLGMVMTEGPGTVREGMPMKVCSTPRSVPTNTRSEFWIKASETHSK